MNFSRSAGCGSAVLRLHVSRSLFARCVVFLALIAHAALTHAKDTAPVIRGTPRTSVLATDSYSFQPSATDKDRDRLTFAIKNKPSWAAFDSKSGKLHGTPAQSNAGMYKNITIFVGDGKMWSNLHPFNINVVALINRAPTLGRAPPNSVSVGRRYVFQPSVSNAGSNRLTFSIRNKPSWLSLNTATGQLQGTPDKADVGNYRNILLSLSDGRASTSLPAFSIAVTASAPASTASSLTLDWVPPTEHTDSSVLTDLAGYRIHYGTTGSSLSHVIELGNPGLTRYVMDDLESGTWYFAMTAYTRQGAESAYSGIVQAVVP